jgi:uncharacterized Tic20 family protein
MSDSAASPGISGDSFQILGYFQVALGFMIGMVSLLPALMIWIGASISEPAAEGHVFTEGAKATAMAGNVLAGAALVLGLAAATAVVFGGVRLARRGNWRYCVFSSALLCLFVPLGTLLGGLILARLLDARSRAAFSS